VLAPIPQRIAPKPAPVDSLEIVPPPLDPKFAEESSPATPAAAAEFPLAVRFFDRGKDAISLTNRSATPIKVIMVRDDRNRVLSPALFTNGMLQSDSSRRWPILLEKGKAILLIPSSFNMRGGRRNGNPGVYNRSSDHSRTGDVSRRGATAAAQPVGPHEFIQSVQIEIPGAKQVIEIPWPPAKEAIAQ
jgi:hypothetical protein